MVRQQPEKGQIMAKEKKAAENGEEKKVTENTAETKEETEEKKESKREEKKAKKSEEAKKIEELEKSLSDANDKFLRTAAEYDNFRRRSQKEKEAIYNDSKADAVAKLIPVMDNFERAAATGSNLEDYKKGIEMTVKQLFDALVALGVEQFGEEGETFDPNIHNGVSHIDDENLGENTIASVYQKGYKIGDRIIRHAVVVVAN